MTIKQLCTVLLFCYTSLYGSDNCLRALNADGFRLHAEFEKMNAIWITWSSDEAKIGYPYSSVQTEVIRQLVPYINVKVVVKNEEELCRAQAQIEGSGNAREVINDESAESIVDPSLAAQCQISYLIIPSDTIFLRDVGPHFLKNSSQELEIASFNFNNWGHLQFEDSTPLTLEKHNLNKMFGLSIADMMGVKSLSTEIISEGGNRDHNGQGTMIVVETVDNQRNPSLTKEQMDEEYKRVLGMRKIIRLKHGMYQDEVIERGPIPSPNGIQNAYTLLGNSGHLDAFCRFVGPQTILLAEVDQQEAETDPIAYENRIRLEQNYNILKTATDVDGNPFNIVRMPATDSFYITLNPEDSFYEYLLELNFPDCKTFLNGKFPKEKELPFLLPTSYLNFIFANEFILLPKFWREGVPISTKIKDEKAASILKALFPDKRMVSIDVLNVNICGGGIHCLTQHEP